MGDIQHKDRSAAHLDLLRNTQMLHTKTKGCRGRDQLLAGGAVLLQDLNGFRCQIIFRTDQQGGVANHQKATGGRKLRNSKSRFRQLIFSRINDAGSSVLIMEAIIHHQCFLYS